MDGVAVTLQTSEEAEGEEADGKTDEGHGDTHPGDDGKKKLMDAPLPLKRNKHTVGLTFNSTLVKMIGAM